MYISMNAGTSCYDWEHVIESVYVYLSYFMDWNHLSFKCHIFFFLKVQRFPRDWLFLEILMLFHFFLLIEHIVSEIHRCWLMIAQLVYHKISS